MGLIQPDMMAKLCEHNEVNSLVEMLYTTPLKNIADDSLYPHCSTLLKDNTGHG